MKKIIIFSTLLVGMMFGTVQAADLQVNASGILTGATGVDVNGMLYDVAFFDGTCAQAYGACDDAHFAFQDSISAVAAANALLNQVFIVSPLGNFETLPSLTYGCSYPTSCTAWTAYALAQPGYFAAAINFDGGQYADFAANIGWIEGGYDTTLSTNYTWAVWTASPVSAVPEASSSILLSAGLLTLVATRRRYRSV